MVKAYERYSFGYNDPRAAWGEFPSSKDCRSWRGRKMRLITAALAFSVTLVSLPSPSGKLRECQPWMNAHMCSRWLDQERWDDLPLPSFKRWRNPSSCSFNSKCIEVRR
jgi:hypothetical protein